MALVHTRTGLPQYRRQLVGITSLVDEVGHREAGIRSFPTDARDLRDASLARVAIES